MAYHLLFPQQTINLYLKDSMVIKDFHKLYPRHSWTGLVQPLMSEGYFVLHDSIDLTKAFLKNYFDKSENIVFNLKEPEKDSKKRKNKKLLYFTDMVAIYPKVYILFDLNLWQNKNYLYEFDLLKKNYKVYGLHMQKDVIKCRFSMLNNVGGHLWISGFSDDGYLCIYDFHKNENKKLRLTKKLMDPLFDVTVFNTGKSDFLRKGDYFPFVHKNTPTSYLYSISAQRATATITNPHFGLIDVERYLSGPPIACGGDYKENTKNSYNSYWYSGIKTFQLEEKSFFCQAARCPVKITDDMFSKYPPDIPEKYYLTIWDHSLNIVADIPLNEQLIDISEAGAFTFRYDGDDAVIYRYRIEFSENSLNENTQR
jgi:hypothetical protein